MICDPYTMATTGTLRLIYEAERYLAAGVVPRGLITEIASLTEVRIPVLCGEQKVGERALVPLWRLKGGEA